MTKRTNLRVIRGFRLDRVSLDDEPGAIPIIILGRILSSPKIFNQAAFQIEIKLLSEYPFKAPEVRFVKKIYHPNVDSDGKICDQLLYEGEEHKPTTPLLYIIKRIAFLIDNPKLDHAVNHEIAVEYEFNRPEFNRKASELVKLYDLSQD
ncbi:hypothetical protein I4U23_016127 [Adineta vaga]|nr:hypothetical protein I4U23_016127 [Adineta vaga]